MKVNEVIVESEDLEEAGFWDTVKAAGAGALGIPSGNAAANFNQSTGASNTAGWAKTVAARWQKEHAPSIPAGTSDQKYKTYLDKFLNQYLGGDYSSNIELAGSTNPTNVAAYIKQAVDAERLGDVVQQEPAAQAAEPAAQAAEPAATKSKRELAPLEYEPPEAAAPAPAPAPAAPAPNWQVIGGKKYDLNDPKNAKLAQSIAAGKDSITGEPVTPKPTLNIPDGATPREAEEYRKRFQNDLNVWNKYNNPDYAEPAQVAPPAATGTDVTADDWAAAMADYNTPPPVPAAAKTALKAAGYGSGWNAKQGKVTVNTGLKPKQQAPMANVQANKPAQNQFANVKAKRPGEPATAESAGGIPWKLRK